MSKELLKRVRDTLHELEETHYDLYWDIQTALEQNGQESEPLFTSPQSVKLRSYAQAEEDLKRLEKRCPLRCDFSQAMKDLKREPLSDEEIFSIGYIAGFTLDHVENDNGNSTYGFLNEYGYINNDPYLKFARAIEKAHGIGETK